MAVGVVWLASLGGWGWGGSYPTMWGSLAGLTVKRDGIIGLAPTADLALTGKSSFLWDSLLLALDPDGGTDTHRG